MPIFGESVLKAAITTWSRTIRLLTIILVVIVVIGLGLYFGVPGLVTKMNIRGDDIEIRGGTITLRLCGKELRIVDVPAYQLTVPSGVKLEADTTIKISASGLVSLSVFPPISSCVDLMKSKDIEDLKKNLVRLFHYQAAHSDWRKPNGELYYVKEEEELKDEPACAGEDNTPRQVYPGLGEGYLLAFIVRNPNDNPHEALIEAKKNKRILKIGNTNTIKYNAQNKKFESDNNTDIDPSYIGGELFFTVNDSLIRSSNIDDIKWSKDCEDKFSIYYNQQFEIHTIRTEIDKYIAEKRMSDPRRPYGTWYLDNRGSFTVSILKEKQYQ